MIFKAKYYASILWIALYDYMRMYEWLIGVEYDVYHSVMHFLLYLDCEKLNEVVELYDVVDVDECVYVTWWWTHIC
jgi:hypothetical protein